MCADVRRDGLDRDPRAIILHTRYATQGSPEQRQQSSDLQQADRNDVDYNGWLTNEREVLAKFKLRKDGEVDSETVLRLIEHFLLNGSRSINRAIKLAMRELKGVFACALISETISEHVWLWRDNNPLCVVRDRESGAFIFASTEELLRNAIETTRAIYGGKINEFPNAVSCPPDGRQGRDQGVIRKIEDPQTAETARQGKIESEKTEADQERAPADRDAGASIATGAAEHGRLGEMEGAGAGDRIVFERDAGESRQGQRQEDQGNQIQLERSTDEPAGEDNQDEYGMCRSFS